MRVGASVVLALTGPVGTMFPPTASIVFVSMPVVICIIYFLYCS